LASEEGSIPLSPLTPGPVASATPTRERLLGVKVVFPGGLGVDADGLGGRIDALHGERRKRNRPLSKAVRAKLSGLAADAASKLLEAVAE
jgi:hypothetical protein